MRSSKMGNYKELEKGKIFFTITQGWNGRLKIRNFSGSFKQPKN